MSWNFTGVARAGSHRADVEAAATVGRPQSSLAEAEANEQINTAVDGIMTVIEGLSCGPLESDFSFQAHGHANPGHDFVNGWSNDSCGFNVERRKPEVTE